MPPSAWSSSSSPGRRSRSLLMHHARKRKRRQRAHRPTWLGSPLDLSIPLFRENGAPESAVQSNPEAFHSFVTPREPNSFSTDVETAPDLLQLFKIFQFNRPERTPLRMVVNITLVGTIQSIRLLVTHDASVQDVIKASLKAYIKEGRLPRHCLKHQSHGLHYSPFCLESIDPTESICSLMTRNFFLSPSLSKFSISRERRAWWKFFRFL